jgi:hypothetical protein
MAEAETNEETETMKTQIKIALASALVLLAAAFAAPNASASFGLQEGSVDAGAHDEAGDSFTQAAGHPASVKTEFRLKTEVVPGQENINVVVAEEAPLRQVTVGAPPGLVGNPTATPRCSLAEFLGSGQAEFLLSKPPCPDSTQVGLAYTEVNLPPGLFGPESVANLPSAIYNLQPQEGQPALFGFFVTSAPVLAVPSIRSEGDYGIDFNVVNIDTTTPVLGNEFTFWGDPASPAHDEERGLVEGVGSQLHTDKCSDGRERSFFDIILGIPLKCPSGAPERAFLTNPTDCAHGPFDLPLEVQSWKGTSDRESIVSQDDEGNPSGVTHCERVPFKPSISAETTTDKAESPSGLDFELRMPDAGLNNPEGLAQSMLKKAVVRLPEGVTANPSAAEGLGVCTPADFAREKLETKAGEGCPNQSKLGTVQIDSPLLEEGEEVEGALFLGAPDDPSTTTPGAENPFDSFLSLYFVAKVPERGVIVKVAGKVEPDPVTGQLTTTFENLPQLPFSSFKLHFREGGRAPLVSEPTCGQHTTEADLTPYANPGEATHVEDVSLILHGSDGGACPAGGVPPFRPSFEAGSLNNNAKSFSPFGMRLTRRDGEQDMTKFSSVLPPGVLGKLAGVSKCPEAAIAAAGTKTGKQELASPSCPANSQIGHISVGAGVGSVLTYVGGKVYLGGPYHGDPLSVIVITPAVAGPFDVGTVVTREALTLNPETAEVEVDGAASDPIPHILKGIPLKLRDLRVYVDRDNFIINPTSCDPSSAKATLFGSFLDVFNPADDVPVGLADRYQAANCANLGFKPNLKLNLKGGTKRGGHPGLKATYTPRKGDANLEGLTVRLPSSAFLDQGHIRTICTRVQFAAKSCPKAAQYGFIKATTPLLDEPLEGPVYLRSSSHKLPDLVFDLHGLVDVEVATRIDSVHGGIRATVEDAPDAPLTKVVLTMQGAKKGLIVNSRNLCGGTNRANVTYAGQNGKEASAKPQLQPDCGGKRKHKRQRGRG